MDLPENVKINDIRTDFRGISFSGFKVTEVKKKFLTSMYEGKVEPACYWCAELICAGQYMDVWETLLLYLAKYIHLGNPKLAIYLDKRFAVFRAIMQNVYLSELEMRNNKSLRDLFAEIVCILTTSPKKNSMETIKLNPAEEFDMTFLADKLKAPTTEYCKCILQKEDPKELAISVNELAYHVGESNMMQACYWVEWIVEFEAICKKRKQSCLLDRRTSIPVDFKLQREPIWIVFDVLQHAAKTDFQKQLLQSILNLFCIKFTPGSVRKRRHLLYFAVAIVTEPYVTREIVSDKDVLQTTVSQIFHIYKQIKKNEESPNTDYLFSGLDSGNYQKSLQKMEVLNAFEKL